MKRKFLLVFLWLSVLFMAVASPPVFGADNVDMTNYKAAVDDWYILRDELDFYINNPGAADYTADSVRRAYAMFHSGGNGLISAHGNAVRASWGGEAEWLANGSPAYIKDDTVPQEEIDAWQAGLEAFLGDVRAQLANVPPPDEIYNYYKASVDGWYALRDELSGYMQFPDSCIYTPESVQNAMAVFNGGGGVVGAHGSAVLASWGGEAEWRANGSPAYIQEGTLPLNDFLSWTAGLNSFLDSVRGQLVLKSGNFSQLNATIEAAENIDGMRYTPTSFASLVTTLADAKAFVAENGEIATTPQALIDEKTANLAAAIAGLRLLDANVNISIDDRIVIEPTMLPDSAAEAFNPEFAVTVREAMAIQVIAAAYDSVSGKLIDMNIVSVSLEPLTPVLGLRPSVDAADGRVYRFFIWDNSGTPLTAITIAADVDHPGM